MSKANTNGQNYANLKNIWHHQKYMKQYNIINDPTYPFVDNSIINSPNPTGWGQYSGKHTGKNSCGCDVELKSNMVENMCSSCNSGIMLTSDHMAPIDRLEPDQPDRLEPDQPDRLEPDPSANTSQTVQTQQSEQISNQLNATKATTKSPNQDIKKKKETYFSPLTHDFCNATKGGKKLAF